jgi:hypothetical protein
MHLLATIEKSGMEHSSAAEQQIAWGNRDFAVGRRSSILLTSQKLVPDNIAWRDTLPSANYFGVASRWCWHSRLSIRLFSEIAAPKSHFASLS